MARVMDVYGYNDKWKARVDRSSEDWRAYCEVVVCLKKCFIAEAEKGRDAAHAEFLAYCADLEGNLGVGHSRVVRLRNDFLLVGSIEGNAIRAQLLQEAA